MRLDRSRHQGAQTLDGRGQRARRRPRGASAQERGSRFRISSGSQRSRPPRSPRALTSRRHPLRFRLPRLRRFDGPADRARDLPGDAGNLRLGNTQRGASGNGAAKRRGRLRTEIQPGAIARSGLARRRAGGRTQAPSRRRGTRPATQPDQGRPRVGELRNRPPARSFGTFHRSMPDRHGPRGLRSDLRLDHRSRFESSGNSRFDRPGARVARHAARVHATDTRQSR